jgi:raffinose/stachyose/melibiose transport system substrate-binding protein
MLILVQLLSACGDSTPTVAAVPNTTTAAVASTTTTAAPAATTTAAASTTTTAAAATTTAAPVTVVVPPAKASGLTGKIVWWHITNIEPGKSTWQAMADAYMKANPGVTIEITVLENDAFKSKLATVMQSGNPPDLFQSWGGGTLQQYVNAGLVKDISEDLKGGWADTFNKAPLDVYTVNGKNYGVPWDMGAVGFYYNKALFQKAGITATPKTWSEFLSVVQKLKAANITPISLGEKDQFPGHFYWAYLATRIGGKAAFDKAYSQTGSFADTAYVQAGQKLKELAALDPFPKGFLGLTYGDQEKVMVDKTAAMELMGQWAIPTEKGVSTDKQGLGSDLGFFPFPTVEGGAGDPSDVLGGGNGIAVGKNASPVAIDFLKYLTSVENQRLLAQAGLAIPTVKGAEDSMSEPLYKDVQSLVSHAKYFQLYYDQYLPPATGAVVNDSVQALLSGSLAPQAVAQAVQDSAASELKK